MEYIFNPTRDAKSYIPLDLVKQYLRIEHIEEDQKIEDLIESSLDYFEERTGFITRAGDLQIKFSFKDRLDYEKRKERSYSDFWEERGYSY